MPAHGPGKFYASRGGWTRHVHYFLAELAHSFNIDMCTSSWCVSQVCCELVARLLETEGKLKFKR